MTTPTTPPAVLADLARTAELETGNNPALAAAPAATRTSARQRALWALFVLIPPVGQVLAVWSGLSDANTNPVDMAVSLAAIGASQAVVFHCVSGTRMALRYVAWLPVIAAAWALILWASWPLWHTA